MFAIWLAVFAWRLLSNLPQLKEWSFPDPDDAMRLLQVRDWLAGQSWFDVTQYRLNPPAGAPMHWSRLVDLPIAGVILIVRPLLGEGSAEMAALILVPMVTLGIAMLLVYGIAARISDRSTALLAAAVTPISLGAMTQMRLMRIDHHGWQIVLALAAMLALLGKRAQRSGFAAGALMAVWLNISIEALPFAAAIAGWLSLSWLRDKECPEQLKAYTLGLAAVSAVLFALTHSPSTWLILHPDALNAAHLAGFGAACLSCQLMIRSDFSDWRLRLGALALVGIFSAAVLWAVDPHFLQGPFASLDPVVDRIWYATIKEGQPVWKLEFKNAAMVLSQQLVGLIGAAIALRTCRERREEWWTYTFLLAVATILSIFVIREGMLASLMSMPATAFLCTFVLGRARAVPLMPARILATFGALCIMTPAYAVTEMAAPSNAAAPQSTDRQEVCTRRSEVEKLNALPPSILASPLDITPAILLWTSHRAIGSGHHRNVSGIRDMVLLFVEPPSKGPEIIDRRHIGYVVFCPNTEETLWWASNGPTGLAAMLNHGKAPDWLEPVNVPGLRTLRVWRVRPDRFPAAPSKT